MITPIEEGIEILRQGQTLILVDDEDRENEGDFVCAAQACTPEIVNFMATHGRGLICVPMESARMAALDLPLMVSRNTALMGTNFTVSVDAVRGTTTGISAADRAQTVRVLADPATRPEDLARPGHIFPISARRGGVLVRAGHTEGTADLARLAGFSPIGVLCEILKEDGSMARMPDLERIAVRFGLKIVTIRDLIAHRVQNERFVECVVETTLPNEFGEWRMRLYENTITNETHIALIMGEPADGAPALVRVHSSCLTGDTLGSQRCDCGAQLRAAMARIAEEGRGAIVYMQQEGRGIGLKNKILAYQLQDEGKDTVEANEALGFAADLRDYGIGAQILRDLGLHDLRLMTNNPRKTVGLEAYGLRISERIPIEVGHHERNRKYLCTKKEKMGHLIASLACGESGAACSAGKRDTEKEKR